MIEPKKTLRDLFRYPILQEGRYTKLRLDKNENVEGFSETVIREMLSNISPHFLAAYPEPYTLYEKIAKRHQLDIDNILVTAGSEMAIRYLFECFLESADEVIILNPSFAMFEIYAKICGAKVVFIDYDRDFHVSSDAIMAKMCAKTRIVAIANPNNPTGTVIPQKDLIRVMEEARKLNAVTLIDEAYFYFYRDTMVPYCKDFWNLIVTRSFSKACGLAGVRLGYAIGNSEVLAQVKKLQPIDHVNSFAVKLGEYILDHENLIWDYAKEVQAGRKFLLEEIDRVGLKARDGFGNFVLVDLGEKKAEIVECMRRRGVIVGSNLRLPFESNYIRATAGPVSEMKTFLSVLAEVMKATDTADQAKASVAGENNSTPMGERGE